MKHFIDIVIPRYSEVGNCRRLVESIDRHSKGYAYRIYVIDNTEKGECVELFKKYSHITVTHHPENLGWVGGVNTGWKQGTGDIIVTMNDDTEVAAHWLDTLVSTLDTGLAAIVFPVCSGGYRGSMVWVHQNVHHDYPLFHQFTSYEEAAKAVKEKYKDKFHLVRSHLSFFTFAMKREMIDKVGYLDDQFNHGGCDDDDYCKRTLNEGLNIAIATDTLVFHKVSASGGGYGEGGCNMRANEKKYKAKHGIPDKPKVLIAVPSMTAKLDVDLVELLFFQRSNDFQDFEVKVMDLSFCSRVFPVDRARNVICQEFLKSDNDFLLMIDDDIVPPNYVAEMARADKPIIAATCFGWVATRTGESGVYPVIFDWNEKDGCYEAAKKLNDRGVIECDAVGTGCIMLRRDVVVKMFENHEWPFEFEF